jgi:hypothetical protein
MVRLAEKGPWGNQSHHLLVPLAPTPSSLPGGWVEKARIPCLPLTLSHFQSPPLPHAEDVDAAFSLGRDDQVDAIVWCGVDRMRNSVWGDLAASVNS